MQPARPFAFFCCAQMLYFQQRPTKILELVAHRPEFVEVSTGGKGFGRHLVLIGSRLGEKQYERGGNDR